MKTFRKALSYIVLSFAMATSAYHQVEAQQRKEIVIEQANQMRNLKIEGQEIRRLIGDVIIRHDDATMKCDSAYEYVGTNRFDAFSRVVIMQENSTLYGDTLRFNGNTKTGKVRGDTVRLVDEEATLVTQFIDFNTQQNSANFFNGGIITTSDARFSSQRGYFYTNEKRYVFEGGVAYQDPDILVNTDSLEYHSDTETIYFYGPSRIYGEEEYLYSEDGWHNRETNQSEFKINTFIDNGDQRLFGDLVYYDQEEGYAKINGNGCIIDTTRNLILYGHEIDYFEKTEYSEVRKDPVAISISEQGDSLYYRGDLIIGESVKDSIITDSTLYQLVKGVDNVRFYRSDIQGVCDSMVFHGQDSILFMHKSPILWNESHQLSANDIKILFKNENIDRMEFYGASFVCSQEDSTKFNQIKGREMIGYFQNGNLVKIDVNGNGETVYYIRDKEKLSAVNKAESSRLSIAIRDNKVSSIMFKNEPNATLFPIAKVELQDVMLSGFVWHNSKRPLSKGSIFPENFNPDFYIPIETKANLYRQKKTSPAKSLTDFTGSNKLEKTMKLKPLHLNTHPR
ncbi:MAG: OstA-like protein [Bacteroidales bacterium]